MDTSVIAIIIIAFLGPLLVYLTRYVVKGRTAAAIEAVVRIGLRIRRLLPARQREHPRREDRAVLLRATVANPCDTYPVARGQDRRGEEEPDRPYFKWLIYFMVGVVFAFVL